MKTLYRLTILIALGTIATWAHSFGPDPRYTGAPGDDPKACTACHFGTPLNGGAGSVKIVLPGAATYTPGVTQHILVQVADPAQKRWGFQLTARLATDLANGQAGDFTPSDGNTQVICDNGQKAPCPSPNMVKFIEHTSAGTRPGTANGATFELDWTPPAAGSGDVMLYAAGNAANGDNNLTGDHIYTTSVKLSAASSPPPAPTGPSTRFTVHNLVSDLSGLADQTDPNLVNPWGISLSPSGPFWVSNNHSGTTTLYNSLGQPFTVASINSARVPAPPSGGALSAPTGQAFNSTRDFVLPDGQPSLFLFATEDGTISGWNTAGDVTTAVLAVDNSGTGAVYKGLALGGNASGHLLYAANFNSGKIDVFDAAFNPTSVAGGFTDPNLPAGFAPFNIQRLGNRLFVTYARQDAANHDDVAGPGNGYVDVFDMDGNLKKRLVSQGPLNSPWGLAIAPAFFGDYSGTLLVGNFGDGWINAFDLTTGEFIGTLQDSTNAPIAIPGLWALQAGNGKNGGDSQTIYFTAGFPGGGNLEDHGLFGAIAVAPSN